MWLFALFVAVPMIEIALFIQVGGAIGLGWTLIVVLLTAMIGTALVRSQGRLAMAELRKSFNSLNDPTEPLAHGAMILFSGALLLTPGFFTDACGFALLVPGIRSWVFRQIRDRIEVRHMGAGPHGGPSRPDPRAQGPRGPRGPARGDVIDGDYTEVEIKEPDPDRPRSGWTRH
ncbi:FxsA family protein [Palleronia sp. LCG004]|uniref:FxsA family protein n=1 Tax=Palleronia sp. LCG004 TaxID=3079304 RepID=UPI002942892E|nr:FxsA family protein [Palleronia sp. LCG004]WOI55934.1 FxsA family protein [Palleronia sp. LCG004]